MRKNLWGLLLALVSFTGMAKPNIVFIYADDMGWTGSSVAMFKGDATSKSDYYQTPNLEKLAARGMIFSQAYSPSSMCTPSRASVLTGLTPAQLHITTPGKGRVDSSRKVLTPVPKTQLPKNIATIGTMLKQQGYATALLGKWHIGRTEHAGMYGFDVHDGVTHNDAKGSENDPKEIFSLTERGIAFIEQNVKKGKPFYLQISHYAVHSPVETLASSSKKFKSLSAGKIHKDVNYAGMTWDLDTSLAQLYKALERLKITDHTYVVFMSDNGAAGNRRKPNNSPLYMGKATLFEGGIRVPLIIAGPNVQTGYSSTAVTGTDLFATFGHWAGAKVTNSESVNLTPLLQDKAANFNRSNDLLFHFPHYARGRKTPQSALIRGNWKLLRDWDEGQDKLFNLASDIGEAKDLAKQEVKLYQQMQQALDSRLQQIGAQLPVVNQNSG